MRVISVKRLREFWVRPECRDAEQALRAWHTEAKKACWRGPHEIKGQYRSASFVGKDRVVFNICGNKYRLVVAVRYDLGIVFVRFIGSHRQYDHIDVEKI